VAAQTGRQVAIDTADVSLFRGRVDLRNFRVVDHDAGPLATFERLDIRFRPLDLLRGHVRIVDATLAAPTIRIVRLAPRQFNVSDLVRPGGAGPGRLGFTIDRLVIRDGSITLEDRTSTPARTWQIDGVSVDARDASTTTAGPAGTVSLQARVANGPLQLALRDVRLAPLALRGSPRPPFISGAKWQLTFTSPTTRRSATRNARSISRVNTVALSP